MKIAFLSVFYPYRGGIAQFNAALYRALEKKNDLKAFTFTRQYPYILFPGSSQFVDENDKPDKIPALRILDSVNPLTYIKTAKEIIRYKPDLLLIQNWMPFFAPSFGWVAHSCHKKDIPAISIMANVKPHEPNLGDKLLTRYFLKRSDAFVVLAQSVANDLLEMKPEARYIYHPHPNYEHFGNRIEKNEARQILNIPVNKKVILYFGLIRKYKGLDLLLDAMKDTPDDYYILIAGEVYGEFDEYMALIEKYKLFSKVLLDLRYINDDEVAKYFSAADVCVLPYKTATQSGVTGIANHFGVPVISTDVGGLKEVIEPFGTGLVIEKPDSQLLHNAIINFFENNLAENFKKNINSFKEKYTWDSLAQCIINLYSSLEKNA